MTAPTMTSADADVDDNSPILPSGWRGLLLPVNTVSGDNRIFLLDVDAGVVPQRPLPLAFSAQLALADGHDGSVVVGLITRLWLDQGGVWGEGPFDLSDPVAADWASKVGRGVAGWVSADLSDIVAEEVPLDPAGAEIPQATLDAYSQAVADGQDVEPPEIGGWLFKVSAWKMMGATLVASPAFEAARVQPVYDFTSGDQADDAATTHTGAMVALVPCAEDAARLAVEGGDPVDELHATLAYLGNAVDWSPENRDAVTSAIRELGWAGSLMGQVWAHASFNPSDEQCAVYLVNGDGLPEMQASALALAQGCGGPQIPDQHSPFIAHVTAGYDMDPAALSYTGPVRFDRLRLAFGGTDIRDIPLDGVTAALTASACVYDAADFSAPEPDELTALTITDDGRVYGHLASFDSCHIGYSECVSPPTSACNYAYFHQGEIATSNGPLPVGKITLGTGHAGMNASARAAAEHYDNTGTVVAVVRCRDGVHGPWLSGRILPGVGDDRVDELRRSGISGDWRGVTRNAADPELVAVLAVNVPGFPVPRQPVKVLAASGVRTLIAAGVPRVADNPTATARATVPLSIADRGRVTYFDSREFQAGVLATMRAARVREHRVAAAAARVRAQRTQIAAGRMRSNRVAIARRRVTEGKSTGPDSDEHRTASGPERLARAAALVRAARLAAAVRRVRTPAGERRYGVPIGSPIPAKGTKPKVVKKTAKKAAAKVPDVGDVPAIGDLLAVAPSRASDTKLQMQLAGLESTYGPYKLKLTHAEYRRGGAKIDGFSFGGDIVNADGRKVGIVERAIRRDGNGKLIVTHRILDLEKGARGKGFATSFYAASLDWYRRSGVDRVEVHAAMEDGGYAWAMAGFDWPNNHSQRTQSIDNVRERIRKARSTATPADQELLDGIVKRFDAGAVHTPTPREIATLRGNDPTLGRQIMRGSNWWGTLSL